MRRRQPRFNGGHRVTGAAILLAGTLIFSTPSQAACPVVASGSLHTVALRDDGIVVGWGDNNNGQLGDGTFVNRLTPVQAVGLTGITALSAGSFHTLALGSDGTVWAWGFNGGGVLGDGTFTRRSVRVQVTGLTDVIAIAAGRAHSVALKSDGTVWIWGSNGSGQLGDGAPMSTNPTYRPLPAQALVLTGVAAIAAGEDHCLALKADGTVWSWGLNSSGQLGDGTTTYQRSTPAPVVGLSGVATVAGGGDSSFALKSDGTAWAWGRNSAGQLGDGTTTGRRTPVQISGLSDIAAINAGLYHALASKSDGTVWSWGSNGSGAVGDGTGMGRTTPVQLSTLNGIVAIGAGHRSSFALTGDGRLQAWGWNPGGQLGDGTLTTRFAPVLALVSNLGTGGCLRPFALQVTALPANGGSVNTNPAPNCGSTYSCGQRATLTALPSTGFCFEGWSGDCLGTANITSVSMSAPRSCTASFAIGSTILTTVANPLPGGTISGNPIGRCQPATTVVTLTANPTPGYVFLNWSGDCTGSFNTTTVLMGGDRTCVANFDPLCNPVTRYRLYNPFTGDHHYTTSRYEYDLLPTYGWVQEGGVYSLCRLSGLVGGIRAKAYYRLYNPTSGWHHWTLDAVENAALGSLGWVQEGPDGYLFDQVTTGTAPLYRLYNRFEGWHHWTPDLGEYTVLQSLGWTGEGVSGHVLAGVSNLRGTAVVDVGDADVFNPFADGMSDPDRVGSRRFLVTPSAMTDGSVEGWLVFSTAGEMVVHYVLGDDGVESQAGLVVVRVNRKAAGLSRDLEDDLIRAIGPVRVLYAASF